MNKMLFVFLGAAMALPPAVQAAEAEKADYNTSTPAVIPVDTSGAAAPIEEGSLQAKTPEAQAEYDKAAKLRTKAAAKMEKADVAEKAGKAENAVELRKEAGKLQAKAEQCQKNGEKLERVQ